jgi:1-acyl-sn-glycerol-3-phosphate acyltransferase
LKLVLIIRSILAGVAFVVLTLSLSVSAILFSLLTTSIRIPRLHMKWWGQGACWLFGVKVTVFGKERWKRDSGGVVLFNHTSFFDIFAMVGFLPDMRFGAKIELFKIPLFGAAMRRVGILPIDRQRREKVFAIYQQAVERLSSGEKIALAPEGKRTSNPQVLSQFKSGPFIFALQSRVDLIPVVIKGAYEVLPKDQVLPNIHQWCSEIQLFVLEPISTQNQTLENKMELQKRVREKMQGELNSNQEVV